MASLVMVIVASSDCDHRRHSQHCHPRHCKSLSFSSLHNAIIQYHSTIFQPALRICGAVSCAPKKVPHFFANPHAKPCCVFLWLSSHVLPPRWLCFELVGEGRVIRTTMVTLELQEIIQQQQATDQSINSIQLQYYLAIIVMTMSTVLSRTTQLVFLVFGEMCPLNWGGLESNYPLVN